MKVRWTLQAAEDLEQICHYIQQDNAEAALATGRRVYNHVVALESHPNRGRPGRVEGTRELVLSPLPYIAVYEIAMDTVVILRILHAARRWP
jgi:addiction module RelE/StbE family toxin